MTRKATGSSRNIVAKTKKGATPSHAQERRDAGRTDGAPRVVAVTVASATMDPVREELLDRHADRRVPAGRVGRLRGVELIERREHGPGRVGQLGELVLGDRARGLHGVEASRV